MDNSKIEEVAELINMICWGHLKFFEENSRWLGGVEDSQLLLSLALEENQELRIVQHCPLVGIGSGYRYIHNPKIHYWANRLIVPVLMPNIDTHFRVSNNKGTRIFKHIFILTEPPSGHARNDAIRTLMKLERELNLVATN